MRFFIILQVCFGGSRFSLTFMTKIETLYANDIKLVAFCVFSQHSPKSGVGNQAGLNTDKS